MIKWKQNPPGIIKILFPEFYWKTENGKVLLTFDDGPVPGNTEKILKFLNDRKIKTIFFCVGENLTSNVGIANEILAEGHQIGNHTFDHQRITKQKTTAIIENLRKVNKLAEDNLNYKINYFRPPHGRFDLRTGRIVNSVGLKNVMWSLLTYDWRNDYQIVKTAIDKNLMKNSIVVLHDSLKSKDIIFDSLKYLCDKVEEKGFTFGEPEECLK